MAQCLSPPRDDKMLQSHSIGGTMLQSPARDEIMLQSHARDETMLQSPSIYDTGRISAQCKNFVASPEIQMCLPVIPIFMLNLFVGMILHFEM